MAAARPLSKSADAFRTISEVADRLDVPQHVLRFWETKFPQVKPLKRGGGRRYYRPEDVALLQRIRALLYDDGYTIKGVQKLFKEGQIKLADLRAEAAEAGTSEVPAAKAPTAEAPPAAGATGKDLDRKALREIADELAELSAILRKAGPEKG